ncbi:MAG: hypothetical protein JO212_18805 [Acetobacteraceae bacterium]|nr:hypothetical protein [Acetobacteraceae bacterium]
MFFQKYMNHLLNLPEVKQLLSDEHFSVDGTLIEAWAELAQGSAKRSLVERPAEGAQKSLRTRLMTALSMSPNCAKLA